MAMTFTTEIKAKAKAKAFDLSVHKRKDIQA